MEAGLKVGIVGAGISGLSTAYYLQKARRELGLDLEISLLERADHLGGVIRTERDQGLLLEVGPEGWASYKRAANDLVDELGLKQALICWSVPPAFPLALMMSSKGCWNKRGTSAFGGCACGLENPSLLALIMVSHS